MFVPVLKCVNWRAQSFLARVPKSFGKLSLVWRSIQLATACSPNISRQTNKSKVWQTMLQLIASAVRLQHNRKVCYIGSPKCVTDALLLQVASVIKMVCYGPLSVLAKQHIYAIVRHSTRNQWPLSCNQKCSVTQGQCVHLLHENIDGKRICSSKNKWQLKLFDRRPTALNLLHFSVNRTKIMTD